MDDLRRCKFCGTSELHINRDRLCGPCATLLSKVAYTPDKLDAATLRQFNERCEYNYKHGLFVPVKQRRLLRYGTTSGEWHCRCCGKPKSDFVKPANGWKNYCTACADDLRHGTTPSNATSQYLLRVRLERQRRAARNPHKQ